MIVFNLKNVLEEEGIASVVVNEYASSGAGELAAFETWPELWVEDENQFERAEAILQKVVFSPSAGFWYCRKCQEKNDVAFRLCWHCGNSYE